MLSLIIDQNNEKNPTQSGAAIKAFNLVNKMGSRPNAIDN